MIDSLDVHEEDVGSELQFFTESVVTIQLLQRICNSETEVDFSTAYEELNKVLLKYLEQPQLLNPHIAELVVPLNERVSVILADYNNSNDNDQVTKQRLQIQHHFVGNTIGNCATQSRK